MATIKKPRKAREPKLTEADVARLVRAVRRGYIADRNRALALAGGK